MTRLVFISLTMQWKSHISTQAHIHRYLCSSHFLFLVKAKSFPFYFDGNFSHLPLQHLPVSTKVALVWDGWFLNYQTSVSFKKSAKLLPPLLSNYTLLSNFAFHHMFWNIYNQVPNLSHRKLELKKHLTKIQESWTLTSICFTLFAPLSTPEVSGKDMNRRKGQVTTHCYYNAFVTNFKVLCQLSWSTWKAHQA